MNLCFIQNGKDYFALDAYLEKEPNPTRNHYHDNYEIYYLIKGSCWYFIGEKSYLLTQGDIAIIPEGVIHHTRYLTATYSRLVINCSRSFIPPSVLEVLDRIPYYAKTVATADRILELYRELQQEVARDDSFMLDNLKNRVGQLLLLIARESQKTVVVKQESQLVEKAVAYIRDHYAGSVTLGAIAGHCFVSREHLSRSFKQETGIGLNEYLNVYRLKKAYTLLREHPEKKISQVALACGFSDSNYFSKVYKKMYGTAPKNTKKEGK